MNSTSNGSVCKSISLEKELSEWREQLKRASHQLVNRSVRSREDTSDIVQESMIQVWQNLEQLGNGSAIKKKAGIIKRIARGHAAKANRKHHAKKRAVRNTERSLNEPASRSTGPAKLAENNEQILMVMKALQKIDTNCQQVLFLTYFQNMSIAEISRELNESYKVIRTRYYNSIESLKQALDS